MEKNLIKAVEKKFGFKILNRGDCEKLSEVIHEQIDKNINYNTLRRIYGLAKPVKTRKDTLDVLSQYVGYISYYHYVNEAPYEISWESRLHLYELKDNKDTKALLLFLERKAQRAEDIVLPIINLIREFLLAKRIRELNILFASDVLKNNIVTYNQKLIIGNSAGILLRSIKLSKQEINLLCKTPFFRATIFEIFVDYSFLNGYYAVFLKYFSEKKDYKNKLFVKCLLNLKSFLNNEKIKNIQISDTQLMELHPILIGRYFSNFLLAEKKEAHFFKIKTIANSFTFLSRDYEIYYEPIVIAIVTNNLKVQSWLIEQIEKHLSKNAYPEPHYLETYHLMKTWYYAQTGAIERAKDLFEKININNFILSYKTFLLFFYYAAGHKLHKTIEFQQLTENYLEKNPYKYLTQFCANYMKNTSKT
ncbi:hypothetical protein N8X76_01340 [Flavobacteriaceae bacterium]|nr:hypothetical protein [Flavobacteriaceae bacterium]